MKSENFHFLVLRKAGETLVKFSPCFSPSEKIGVFTRVVRGIDTTFFTREIFTRVVLLKFPWF